MSTRPRGRARVQNNKPIEKPLTKREIRVFFVRMALLCAAIGGVYWLGWRSPWARADATVHVETPDAPIPLPVVSTPVISAPSTGTAPDAPDVKPEKQVETNPDSDKTDDQPKEDSPKPKRRTRHKRSQTDD